MYLHHQFYSIEIILCLIIVTTGFEMRMNPRVGILIGIGLWCLMVVVLANAYAGTLLSVLSVTKLVPVINSLDEVANSKSCQLLVQGSSDAANDFLVSKI